MAADSGFRDHVMESMAPLEGIACRSMFGGYGIFATGDMFALISGSALFFKTGDSNLSRFVDAGSSRYGSMPYYRVPTEVLEDREALLDWARAAIEVAKAQPKKKPAKK